MLRRNDCLLGLNLSLLALGAYRFYVHRLLAGARSEFLFLSEHLSSDVRERFNILNLDTPLNMELLITAILVCVFSCVFLSIRTAWRQKRFFILATVTVISLTIPLAIEQWSRYEVDEWKAMARDTRGLLPTFRWYASREATGDGKDVIDVRSYTREDVLEAIGNLESAVASKIYTEHQARFIFHGISTSNYVKTGEIMRIALPSGTYLYRPDSHEALARAAQWASNLNERGLTAMRLIWVVLVLGLIVFMNSSMMNVRE